MPGSERADFVWGRKLGAGTFGCVYSVLRHADGLHYCIKEIDVASLPRREQEGALKEVRILASVDHPHVVAYLDSFVQSGILHIVMELCEDGDLHSMLHARAGTPLPEPDVWRLYGQSLAGLHHLHSLKILHRDIKSKNLFLSSRGVKLGDLGVARALGASTEFASTMVGTPYYLSPELCNGEDYNDRADVWSLGCVLYELLRAGQLPFTANNQAALVLKIIRGVYEAPTGYSQRLLQMVADCLQVSLHRRPTSAQLLSRLPAAAAPPAPNDPSPRAAVSLLDSLPPQPPPPHLLPSPSPPPAHTLPPTPPPPIPPLHDPCHACGSGPSSPHPANSSSSFASALTLDAGATAVSPFGAPCPPSPGEAGPDCASTCAGADRQTSPGREAGVGREHGGEKKHGARREGASIIADRPVSIPAALPSSAPQPFPAKPHTPVAQLSPVPQSTGPPARERVLAKGRPGRRGAVGGGKPTSGVGGGGKSNLGVGAEGRAISGHGGEVRSSSNIAGGGRSNFGVGNRVRRGGEDVVSAVRGGVLDARRREGERLRQEQAAVAAQRLARLQAVNKEAAARRPAVRTAMNLPSRVEPAMGDIIGIGSAGGSITPLLRSGSAGTRTLAAPPLPFARVSSAPVCRPSIKQLREVEQKGGAAGGAEAGGQRGAKSTGGDAETNGAARGTGGTAAAGVHRAGAGGDNLAEGREARSGNTEGEEAIWAELGRMNLAASVASTIGTCSGGEDTEGEEHPPTDGEGTEGGDGWSTDGECAEEEEGGARNVLKENTAGGDTGCSADLLAATLVGPVSPPPVASRGPALGAAGGRDGAPTAPRPTAAGAAVGWRIVDELFPDAEASLFPGFPRTDTNLESAHSCLAREKEGDARPRCSQPTLASLQ